MGNQQSNERRNYKIYKITGKDERSKWIRYYLDDYVTYDDGNYKSIDFKKPSTGYYVAGMLNEVIGRGNTDFTSSFDVGDYIKIYNYLIHGRGRNFEFSHSSSWIVGREKVDSEGNVSILAITREVCQEISEVRERRATAAEWSSFDKQAQRAWQLQPPKK